MVNCNKLSGTELKAIVFWFLYNELTGINLTIVKKYDLIGDNTEALEATKNATLAQDNNDNYLEVNMEVAMVDGEIDEDDTEVRE